MSDKFHGVDAAGVSIERGDTCKIFRYWDGYREEDADELPLGSTFEVDILEGDGYEGRAQVGINGNGWIHHKSILVV